MSNPGQNNAPEEILDLKDEYESGDDDVFHDVIEEFEEEEEVAAETRVQLQELEIPFGQHLYIVQQDGSLTMAMPVPTPGPVLESQQQEEARAISPMLDSDDDDEMPVTPSRGRGSPRRGSPRRGSPRRGSPRRGSPRRGSPRHGSRGRRGVRGGVRRGVSSGMRRGLRDLNAWTRGDPLVERFASEEEVSAPLREEVDRLETTRRVRESRRRPVNVEEDDESDDDERFFDGEEFFWSEMGDWSGVKEAFLPESSGPIVLFGNAYDAFRSYWDGSILSHIVKETNRYAQGIQSERFQRLWYETNVDELLVLFAFWMMLGIIKMPTIKSCFTKMAIMRTEIFRSMFVEDRYWNLNRAFHLAAGSRVDPNDVLFPMGPVIDHLNVKFQELYRLHQDICIDESLTLWKGPLGFKQYIKTKSARFGIKSYQICESSTGYLWKFFIYVGRQTTTSTLPTSSSTVLKLIQPLLNRGHVLYMDNWFNSPLLARYLKRRCTDCVGTLRSSRNNVPAIVQRAPLAEGEFIARQSGDMMVVTVQDHKRLTCISTYHNTAQVRKTSKSGRPSQYKLQLIDDYNHGMGGVDKMDQMLEPYLVERKQCINWTRKLFKRLLNISVQNARILLEKSTNTKVDSLVFRLAVVQSIMDKHRQNVPLKTPNAPPPRTHVTRPQFPAERLTGRHFIRRIKITAQMRGAVSHPSNLGRRQCVWCTAGGRKQSKTVYECPQCNVPLCLDVCFEQFHTVP